MYSFKPTPIPDHIAKVRNDVTLGIDFLYVQGMPLLHNISRKIQFRMAQAVGNRQKKTIVEEVKNVIKIYTYRVFKVLDIHGDQEFKCILEDMSPTAAKIVTTDDHVDEVESSIRVFKERCRCIIHQPPYKRYTKLKIIELVCTALRGLNQIPAEKGVSDRISPLTIVTGWEKVDYNKHRCMRRTVGITQTYNYHLGQSHCP